MTQEESNIINLEDTFFLNGHSSKQRYLLKLSPTTLSITTKQEESSASTNNIQLISIDDIYGCLCMKSVEKSNQCHLTLYLYALRPPQGVGRIFSKKPTLHRSQRIFTYGKYDDYERNYAEVTRWYRYVTHAIYLRRNLPRKF